jgi:hypothetical protein
MLVITRWYILFSHYITSPLSLDGFQLAIFDSQFNSHDSGTQIGGTYHIFLAHFLGLNFREYPHRIPEKWYVYVPPSIGS